MSGIAGVFNIPSSPESLKVWATTHAQHHRDINQAILHITGLNLPEYILDPIDPHDTKVWEEQHQIMHQNMDAILGINGFDLTDVNFNNPALLGGWITLNSNEHYQASNILGIG